MYTIIPYTAGLQSILRTTNSILDYGRQSIESTSQSSISCLGRCLLYNRSHHFECLPVNPAQKGNVKNADLEHVQGMHAKFIINDRVWLMSYIQSNVIYT